MSKGSVGDPNLPFHVKLMTAGLAGCIGEVITIPLDTAKVRLQLAGSSGEQKYKNLLGTIATIRQEEGTRGLFKGLSSGLARQIVFCSIRIGLYDSVRNAITPTDQLANPSILYKILAGLTTGFIGIAVANPTDLVKVRLQAEGRLPEGVPRRYNGMVDAYVKIYRSEGIRGFWVGCGPNLIRNSIFNACELASFDQAKSVLLNNNYMEDNIYMHFTASAWAGCMAVLVGQPIDQIKTRLMNQSKDGGKQFNGILDCIVKTVRKEVGLFIQGPMAFYDGVWANASRVVSWNIIMFMSLSQLRNYADRVYFPEKYGRI